MHALAIAASVVRFAGTPNPVRDPVAIDLHHLLVGRGPITSASDQLAALAHREQVAVMASALEPALQPLLAPVIERQRRFDALLELALADIAPTVADVAPTALLKGSAAAAWVYPETAWRMRKDIDLLVGEALPEVRRAMLARGWRDHLDPRASHDPHVARAWPMARELGRTTISIDLHRRLVHGAWCRPDVTAMLSSSVEGRAALPVTNVADTFVHTALHLVGTGYHEPLKGWIDLARLLPLLEPSALAKRARLHRLGTATWAALGVLQRWFSSPVAAHRHALGTPPQGTLIDRLLAGEHATPERAPLPRGLAYRLWRILARDFNRP